MEFRLIPMTVFPQQDSPPELQGLYEPSAVHFTFDSPGWYMLTALLLFFTGILVYRAYRRNRYRREAIAQLNNLERGNLQDAEQILILLKNVANTVYGRDRVASLQGDQWLNFLDSSSGKTQFKALSAAIAEVVYADKPMKKDQWNRLYTDAIKWLNTHERKF